MAKRPSKRRKARTIQPAVTDLYFTTNPGTGEGENNSFLNYIDTAKELSKINRRLYSQGKMYALQGLTFIWRQNSGSTVASLEVTVSTAPNTWVVHNAFVKGKALWNQMNNLVLKDNPSIKGTWADFKVQLDEEQISARSLSVKDGSGTNVKGGDWDISKYVMPQHVVDPVSGQPLAAEEFTATLIGDDTGTKRSLVKAYQESRATVQPIDPSVPADMSTSFFNLLTDSGSQEPELADVIEDQNDVPPYDQNEYPGGDTNANVAQPVRYAAVSASEVDGRISGFIAPCGLIQVKVKGYTSTGAEVAIGDMPAIDMILHVSPGTYKGVAAVAMGQ